MEHKKSTPITEGVSSAAIERMFDYWDEKETLVHACAIMRRGKLLTVRQWEPYSAERIHMLNSMSKTFTAIGVMFAMQEGLLTPDTLLTDIFADRAAEIMLCDNMKRMRIKHLLTMNTGHYPESADFIIGTSDPVGLFLASDVSREPGTKYTYNTGATYMLSLAIRELTGLSLYEYMKPRFFEPLGFEGEIWESDREGNPYGGFGLNINVIDAAKMGAFLLARGKWEGKQLLDPVLIDTATSALVSTGDMAGQDWLKELRKHKEWERNDWDCGYGWQIWRCMHDGAYRADGAFGQYCVVVPDCELVVAVFSGSECSQYLLKGIWEHLVPSVMSGDNAETDIKPRRATAAKGGAEPQTEGARSLIGRRCILPENSLGLKTLCVREHGRVEITSDGGMHLLDAANGGFIYNDIGIPRIACTFPFVIRPTGQLHLSYGFDGDSYILRALCEGYAYYHEITVTPGMDGAKVRILQYPGSITEEYICKAI